MKHSKQSQKLTTSATPNHTVGSRRMFNPERWVHKQARSNSGRAFLWYLLDRAGINPNTEKSTKQEQ